VAVEAETVSKFWIRPAMANPTSDADYIEAAYEDQIRVLYKNLCTALEDGGGNPSSNLQQQCLQRFNTGLRLARLARQLALSASAPAPASFAAAVQVTAVAFAAPAAPAALAEAAVLAAPASLASPIAQPALEAAAENPAAPSASPPKRKASRSAHAPKGA
jgi:hypothetical protein